MRIILRLLSAVFLAGGASSLVEATECQTVVKLSQSGICHTPMSPFYAKTRNFKAFETVEDCLKVGRLSKTKTVGAEDDICVQPGVPDVNRYDRSRFGGWAEANGNCMNTRHELLKSLSTGPIKTSSSGCAVIRGRWLDPYTNQIFSRAGELDIDHLVPLAYAWTRGADEWTDAKRAAFSNDRRNLFVVSSEVNRNKGSRGPTEWLPPNAGFHCQYVTRFQRMVLTFELSPSLEEWSNITRIRAKVCDRS